MVYIGYRPLHHKIYNYIFLPDIDQLIMHFSAFVLHPMMSDKKK